MIVRYYAFCYLSLINIALSSLCVSCAKILAIFPYPHASQRIFSMPILRALAERGHECTVIHGFHIDSDDEIHQQGNLRFIEIDSENIHLDIFEEFYSNDYVAAYNKWQEAKSVLYFCHQISWNVLKNQEVKMLLNSNVTFDMIFMESGQTDALYGFGRHFNAPLVGISTCGSDWNTEYLVGNTSPSIYEPISPVDYKRGLNLFERLYNLAYITEEWLFINWIFIPVIEKLHKHYFPHVKDTITELRSNFSLIFLNQHFTLTSPRPNVPNLIEVGGFHIPDKVPALPSDLANFIDEAQHGVVFFSMGAEIIANRLPKHNLDVLFATFRRLKQRVIIKFESTELQNITDQIYVSDWLPQMSILAHPNVKLFVTHGGVLSILEAAHFATPIIGLPQFHDQFLNTRNMVELGVGLCLNLHSLTVPKLQKAIERILSTETYAQNAVALSQRFRDQPLRPIDTVIYWMEYVIRYRGAPHMKLSTTNLKILDYYCVDRVLIISCRLLLTILVLFILGWIIKRNLKEIRSFVPVSTPIENKKFVFNKLK